MILQGKLEDELEEKEVQVSSPDVGTSQVQLPSNLNIEKFQETFDQLLVKIINNYLAKSKNRMNWNFLKIKNN